MIVASPPGSPTRGLRLLATLMVVLGAYIAFGSLVIPIGLDSAMPVPWFVEGIAALGTALAGIRLLQARPGAVTLGILSISAWLLASLVQAAIIGFGAYPNPFTIGSTAFLVIALFVLVRRRLAGEM